MTQHQRGHALAQRNLDLRHAIGRGHRGDHGAQGQQQVADVARQHMAFAHVGHIAALALMEAHQHAALLRHHPHRQAGAVAVAPGWALQGRQHARGTELADVPEGVLQRTLLDRHLGAGLQVLHGTAATDAKVRAARHHALRGRTQDLLDAGDFIDGLRRTVVATTRSPGRAPSTNTTLPSRRRCRGLPGQGIRYSKRQTSCAVQDYMQPRIVKRAAGAPQPPRPGPPSAASGRAPAAFGPSEAAGHREHRPQTSRRMAVLGRQPVVLGRAHGRQAQHPTFQILGHAQL